MRFNFNKFKKTYVIAAVLCCFSIVLLSTTKSYSNQSQERRIWIRCAAGDETASWIEADVWVHTQKDGWKKIHKNADTSPPVPVFLGSGEYSNTIYVRAEGAKYKWGNTVSIKGKMYNKFDISNLGKHILIEFRTLTKIAVIKRPGKRMVVLENRSYDMDHWNMSFATGYKSDGKWYSEGWYDVTPSTPVYFYMPDGMNNVFCFVRSGSEYQVVSGTDNNSFCLDIDDFWIELLGCSSSHFKEKFWRAPYRALLDNEGNKDGGFYNCVADEKYLWEYYDH